MSTFLKNSSLQKLRPLFHNNIESLSRYAQFKTLFAQNRAYTIFAEPELIDKSSKKFNWYSQIQGEVKIYTELSDEEKKVAHAILKNQLKKLYNRALYVYEHDPDNKAIFKILEKAIQIPDYSDIYVLKTTEQRSFIVLTQWATIKDDYNSPKDIIKKLVPVKIKDLTFKIQYQDGYPAVNEKFLFKIENKEFTLSSDEKGEIIVFDVPFWKEIHVSQTEENKEVYANTFTCNSQDIHVIEILTKEKFYDMKFVVFNHENKPIANQALIFITNNEKQALQANKHGELFLKNIRQGQTVEINLEEPEKQRITQTQYICSNASSYPVIILPRQKQQITPEQTEQEEKPVPKFEDNPPQPIVQHQSQPQKQEEKILNIIYQKKKTPVNNAKIRIDEATYRSDRKGQVKFQAAQNTITQVQIKKLWTKQLENLYITEKNEYTMQIKQTNFLLVAVALIAIALITGIFLFSKDDFNCDCQLYASGFVVSDEFDEGGISKAFDANQYSDLIKAGEYPDIEKAFPNATDWTFDGLAIGTNTKVTIFSQKNFEGEILLDTIGPLIINNVEWKNDERFKKAQIKEYQDPLQGIFPPDKRIWSRTDMRQWVSGSAKITCNK